MANRPPYQALQALTPQTIGGLYDIAHRSEFDRGGHFAAMEVPDLFAEDVREFFLTRLKQD